MSRPKSIPGEVLILDTDNNEAYIRGPLPDGEDYAAIVSNEDDRYTATGTPHRTMGHYGLGTDEDGDVRTGYLYTDPKKKGRGWFPVVIVEITKTEEAAL